jgi:predicted phage terminase large subunit-like protein
MTTHWPQIAICGPSSRSKPSGPIASSSIYPASSANGPAVCQLLKRQVPGLIAIPPKGSKASRAHAVAPLVEAGQVRFARKADSLVDELLAFSPRGGVDDQVDAFCQGVLWIEAQFWRGRGYGTSPVPMVFSR